MNDRQVDREAERERERERERQQRRLSLLLDSLTLELRNCVKVEVAVLGSPSLTVLMVSVDSKAKPNFLLVCSRVQELCNTELEILVPELRSCV